MALEEIPVSGWTCFNSLDPESACTGCGRHVNVLKDEIKSCTSGNPCSGDCKKKICDTTSKCSTVPSSMPSALKTVATGAKSGSKLCGCKATAAFAVAATRPLSVVMALG